MNKPVCSICGDFCAEKPRICHKCKRHHEAFVKLAPPDVPNGTSTLTPGMVFKVPKGRRKRRY